MAMELGIADKGIIKTSLNRRVKSRPEKAGYFLSKKVGKAICDYKMIDDGDRIAVGVSGGKDSLSLLKILNDRRSFVPVRYDIIAVHIDFGYHCVAPAALINYFQKQGYSYHIKKVDILKPGQTRADITCFWCAWNRRKAIFETAREFNCNKVALAHHRDDIIETILLNLLFQGEISAMKPRQELFGGKLTIIRPLAYAQEKEVAKFARTLGFPLPHCQCPNSATSKRSFVEKIITEMEKGCPDARTNIFNSLKRIKKDYLL